MKIRKQVFIQNKLLKSIIPIVLIIIGIIYFSNFYQVSKIIDGDTIKLSTREKIRLWGIDAPELKQIYGKESKQFLSDNIGKYIRIQRKGKDKYNRTLAVIYNLKGENINYKMIKYGMAWVYYYCNNKDWKYTEKQAMKKGVGLFSQKYTPPWEYRK